MRDWLANVTRPSYSRYLVMQVLFVSLLLVQMNVHADFWGSLARGFQKGHEMGTKKRELELEEQRLRLMEQELEMQEEFLKRMESARRAAELERNQIEAGSKESDVQNRPERDSEGSTGTGFYVSNDGHIVTNAHVIGDYKFLLAKDKFGKFFDLDVVAIDRQNDLALLQAAVQTAGLSLLPAASVQKGMEVYAVGFPQTELQGTESKITDGIISSLTGIDNNSSLFQISVPVQSGNSGGPLVTKSGEVVGVIVGTINSQAFFAATGNVPQNINYAIKAYVLENFLISSGILPTAGAKETANPLGFVDDNTVLIAAKSEPFALTSTPRPSVQVQMNPSAIAPNSSIPP